MSVVTVVNQMQVLCIPRVRHGYTVVYSTHLCFIHPCICSVHPCIYALYTLVYALYTLVYALYTLVYALYTLVYALYTVVYALPTPSLHQTYTAVYLLCHSVHKLRFVECKHVFSVFVCISCGKRATKIVSQFVTYNVHNANVFLCDLLYVAHTGRGQTYVDW